jgi:hypothetical protein
VDAHQGQHSFCHTGCLLHEFLIHPASAFPVALQRGKGHAADNQTGLCDTELLGSACRIMRLHLHSFHKPENHIQCLWKDFMVLFVVVVVHFIPFCDNIYFRSLFLILMVLAWGAVGFCSFLIYDGVF